MMKEDHQNIATSLKDADVLFKEKCFKMNLPVVDVKEAPLMT